MKPFKNGLIIGMFTVLLWFSLQSAVICACDGQFFLAFVFTWFASGNFMCLYHFLWKGKDANHRA